MIAMLQDKQYFNPPFNMKAIGKPNTSFLNLLIYIFLRVRTELSPNYTVLKKEKKTNEMKISLQLSQKIFLPK